MTLSRRWKIIHEIFAMFILMFLIYDFFFNRYPTTGTGNWAKIDLIAFPLLSIESQLVQENDIIDVFGRNKARFIFPKNICKPIKSYITNNI